MILFCWKLCQQYFRVDRMVLAFVLINTEIGSNESILKRIGEVDSVKEAYNCYGVYNIIAAIKCESTKQLVEKVRQIQKIDNVRSTLTMTTMHAARLQVNNT